MARNKVFCKINSGHRGRFYIDVYRLGFDTIAVRFFGPLPRVPWNGLLALPGAFLDSGPVRFATEAFLGIRLTAAVMKSRRRPLLVRQQVCCSGALLSLFDVLEQTYPHVEPLLHTLNEFWRVIDLDVRFATQDERRPV